MPYYFESSDSSNSLEAGKCSIVLEVIHLVMLQMTPRIWAAGKSPIEQLPLEILVLILQYLDYTSDLPNLRNVSRSFEYTLTDNIAHIVHNFIKYNYSQEAQLFRPVLKDGWLIPSHPMISAEELFVAKYIRSRLDHSGQPDGIIPPSSLSTKPIISRSLSEPGTAFWEFLSSSEAQMLWVEIGLRKHLGVELSDKRIGLYYVRRWIDAENTRAHSLTSGTRSRANSFLSRRKEVRPQNWRPRFISSSSPSHLSLKARRF